MQDHVEADFQEETADTDDVAIDFIPEPSTLARIPAARPSGRWRPWAIGAGATLAVAMVFAALSLKPGPGTARAAALPTPPPVKVEMVPTAAPDAESGTFELFQLPPWDEEEAAQLATP